MMKRFRILTVLLALSLLTATIGCAPSEAAPEQESGDSVEAKGGYATPEKAAEAFMEALVQEDLEAAFAACAIDEAASQFNLDDYTSWVQIYYPGMDNFYNEPDNGVMTDLNRSAIKGNIARDIKVFYHWVASDAETRIFLRGVSTPLSEAPENQALYERIKARLAEKPWKTLEVVKTFDTLTLPSAVNYQSMLQEQLFKSAKPLGADAITEVGVIFSLEGEHYVTAVRVLRYGNDWKAQSLYSSVLDIAPRQIVRTLEEVPSDEDEEALRKYI